MSKDSKLRVLSTIRFCSNFTSMRCKHFERNLSRDCTLPISALATVTRRSLTAKLLQILILRSGILQNFTKNTLNTYSGTVICVLKGTSGFHKTVRISHVYFNFEIGFTCRITVIFGTVKDGSLLINALASNIYFGYRNMFQNGFDALSKIVDAFLSKSSKFYLVWIIQ